jgi:hypothetical protein
MGSYRAFTAKLEGEINDPKGRGASRRLRVD